MQYHYDQSETSPHGHYHCNECGKIMTTSNHNGKCDKKALVFVFGKLLVQSAIHRASISGSDDAITYGGLTLKYIKKHFPKALP